MDIAILISSLGTLAVSVVIMARVVALKEIFKDEVAAIEHIVKTRLNGFLEVFRKINK